MILQKFLRDPLCKQFLAAMMILLLTGVPAAGSFSAPTEKLNVNSRYGRIRESYSASSEKMIIHIQDAHCVYEAQKNIIGMIHDLYQNHNVSLVTLEGADGYFDYESLSEFPIRESRENVANYFLKKGRIAGSEYLMIENRLPLSYRGAENRDLYIENHASFMASLPKPGDPAVLRVHDISAALDALKGHLFNDSLMQLDQHTGQYAAQNISFGEYAQYLKEQAAQHSIPLDTYKNLTAFYAVSEMESKIDFGKIHVELSTIINELTEIITKDELSQLLYKNLFYKLEKITPTEFFAHLSTLGTSYNYSFSAFSNVTHYMGYLNLYDTINEIEILGESKKLVREIQNQLYDSEDQRVLTQLEADSKVLSKLLELKVTKNELNYYFNNKDNFTAEHFISFIKQHAPTYQIPFNQLNDFSVIAQRLPVLDDFYDIAAKRNEALIENTLAEMELEDTNTAILITGGFHTEGITEILRREGISYHVVSPVLTQQPTTELYLARLAGVPTELEEMLTAERLSVPLVLGESELVDGQNSQQFKDVFRTLLDVDAALNELPEQLPADYQPTVTYLDAFSVRNFPLIDASGQQVNETVKFLAFKALEKTYRMAVLPEGMRIDGAVGNAQTLAGRELVLIEPAAFIAAEQNPAREAISVAANSVEYYLDTAAAAGNAATPRADLISDLDAQLDTLAQNNLIVREDDGSGAVRPTFAYLIRSGVSQANIQPRVAQVDALHFFAPTRAYLDEQGITQIVAYSNHSELTPAEANELNDNLITILQNGNYQLESGKNINAVVQDGIAQVFSTQDTAVKPFVPIPHSVFEAMVPQYERLRLLTPVEASTQGYIELGVVDGQVTVTLYAVNNQGVASPVQAYALESPDALEADIFNLILQARQQAYQDNIGLIGYGNPDNGIAISFNNLDELMAVVEGNPVRQAAVNVLAALAALPGLKDLSRESIAQEGITSVQDLAAYIQAQTPDVELPDLTCAACATAVVHDSLSVGEIQYTRDNFTDYAQFLLQMMMVIDARQRPGGIERADGQIFNSMFAMATAFQVAGRNAQPVSVVPAGQTLSAEQRTQRLGQVLEQLPQGESIILALRTRDDKGHFITIKRSEQGFQVYDALSENFRDGEQAGLPVLVDAAQAMGGIQYILNTYLPDNYGPDAFTGQILAGQSMEDTGQVLASLIDNGVLRTMSRQEQFAAVGAMPDAISILRTRIQNIPDARTVVVVRDLLDSILVNSKAIESRYGAFASDGFFEQALRVYGVETITPQLQQFLSLVKQFYAKRGDQSLKDFARNLAALLDRSILPETFYGMYGSIGKRNTVDANNPLFSADPRALEIIRTHLSALQQLPTANDLKSVYYWARVFNQQGGMEAVRTLLLPTIPVLEYLVSTGINRAKTTGDGVVNADAIIQHIAQSVIMYLDAKDTAVLPEVRDKARRAQTGHPLANISQVSLQVVFNHLRALDARGEYPAVLVSADASDVYWSNVFAEAGQTTVYQTDGKNLVEYLLSTAEVIHDIHRPADGKKPFDAKYAVQVYASTINPFVISGLPVAAPAPVTAAPEFVMPDGVSQLGVNIMANHASVLADLFARDTVNTDTVWDGVKKVVKLLVGENDYPRITSMLDSALRQTLGEASINQVNKEDVVVGVINSLQPVVELLQQDYQAQLTLAYLTLLSELVANQQKNTELFLSPQAWSFMPDHFAADQSAALEALRKIFQNDQAATALAGMDFALLMAVSEAGAVEFPTADQLAQFTPAVEEPVVPREKPEDPLAIKKRAAIQEGASITNSSVAMIDSLRQKVVQIATSRGGHFQTIKNQFDALQQQTVRIENNLLRLSSDELQLVMTPRDRQNLDGLKIAMREIKQIITPLRARATSNPMQNAPKAQAALTGAWNSGQLRRHFDSMVSLMGEASFALDLKKSFNAKLADTLAQQREDRAAAQVVVETPVAEPVRTPEFIALTVMLDEIQTRKKITVGNILQYGLSMEYWEYAVFDHALDGTYKTDLKALFADQRELIEGILNEAEQQGANNRTQTLLKLTQLIRKNIALLSKPEGAVSNRYSQNFLDTINQIGQALGLTEGQLMQLMGQGSFALVDRDGVAQIEGSPRNALALISRIQNIPVEVNRAKGTYHELIESITGQRPDLVSRITTQLETAADNTPESRARTVLQTQFAERYNMDAQPLQEIVREAVAKIFTNDILSPEIVSAFYAEPAVEEMTETLKNAVRTADAQVYEQVTASVSDVPLESVRQLTQGMETIGLTLPQGVEQAIVDNTVEQWFDTVFSTELMAAIQLNNDLSVPQAIERASRSEAVRNSIRRAQERAQLQNVLPRLTTMDFSFLVNDTVSHIIANRDTFYDAQGRPTREMLDYIEAQGGISDTRTLGIAQLIQEYAADEQNVFVIYSLDQDTDTMERILNLYGISPANVVIVDADSLNAENAGTPILGLPAVIQAQLALGDGITLEMSDLVLIATDNDVAKFTADQGAKVYLSPSGILPQNFTVDNQLALGFNVFQAATRMARGEAQYGSLIVSYVGEQNVFISELVERIKQQTGSEIVTLEALVNELGGLKALGELNRSDVEGIVLSFPERSITPDDIQSEFLNRLKAQRMVETSA